MNQRHASFIRLVFCFFSLAFALMASPWAMAADQQPGTIILLDEPIAPYNYGETGEISRKGLTYTLYSEIFKRLGMDFEIQLVPWARVIKTVQHGRADGIPLLMESEERKAFLVFSAPILENKEVFFYRPSQLGDFQWNDFSQLKDYTIGLINGYTYGDPFLAALETYKYRVVYSQDIESNFRMLTAGRVDLTLEDKRMAGYTLAQHPQWKSQVRAAPKAASSYTWHLGISRQSPLAEHLDEINRIIAAMKKDGSLDRIIEQY